MCPTANGGDGNAVIPPYYGPASPWPPTAFPAAGSFTTRNGLTNGLEWPLVNGWLLVEAKWAVDGKWHGVTREWLQLGFARGLNVPTKARVWLRIACDEHFDHRPGMQLP